MSSESPGSRGGRAPRAPIWAEPERGRRRPSVTREQIAEAALALADAEGVEAVSMRRVASGLGVGTMTLYHYVRTKDDLYNLMSDAIMGELLVDEAELAAGWRPAITAIARRSLAVFRRHPWVVRTLDRAGEMGPNGMRHFDQSLAAVEGTGLGDADRLELLALVDDLVFGNALRELFQAVGQGDEDWIESTERYVNAQLATGAYPHIERLLGSGDRRARWDQLVAQARKGDRFESGLEALLDGFERRISGG